MELFYYKKDTQQLTIANQRKFYYSTFKKRFRFVFKNPLVMSSVINTLLKSANNLERERKSFVHSFRFRSWRLCL